MPDCNISTLTNRQKTFATILIFLWTKLSFESNKVSCQLFAKMHMAQYCNNECKVISLSAILLSVALRKKCTCQLFAEMHMAQSFFFWAWLKERSHLSALCCTMNEYEASKGISLLAILSLSLAWTCFILAHLQLRTPGREGKCTNTVHLHSWPCRRAGTVDKTLVF